MTKSDLRTGMVVQLRTGNRYIVYKNTTGNDLICNSTFYNTRELTEYNESMCSCVNNSFDIVKVWNPRESNDYGDAYANLDILWERHETKKLTVKQVSELLGYSVEIIKG